MKIKSKLYVILVLISAFILSAVGLFLSFGGARAGSVTDFYDSVDYSDVYQGKNYSSPTGVSVFSGIPSKSSFVIFKWIVSADSTVNLSEDAELSFFINKNRDVPFPTDTGAAITTLNGDAAQNLLQKLFAPDASSGSPESVSITLSIDVSYGLASYKRGDGAWTELCTFDFALLEDVVSENGYYFGFNVLCGEQTTNLKSFCAFDSNGNSLGSLIYNSITDNEIVPSSFNFQTADKSAYTAKSFSSTGSDMRFCSTNPTTSEWIIFEWESSKNNSVGIGSPDFSEWISNDCAYTSENSAGSASFCGNNTCISKTLFDSNDSEENIKNYIMFNVMTGEVFYKNGDNSWTTNEEINLSRYYANLGEDYSAYGYYAGFATLNCNIVHADVLNLICYSSDGLDLAISGSVDVQEYFTPIYAPSDAEGFTVVKNGGFAISSATASTAEFIVFEWENSISNRVEAVSSPAFFAWINNDSAEYLSGGKEMGRAGVSDNGTLFNLMTNASTTTPSVPDVCKIVYNTVNGRTTFSRAGSPWVEFGGNLNGNASNTLGVHGNAEGNYVGGYYVGLKSTAGVSYAQLKGLKCYDSLGADLGVKIDGKTAVNVVLTGLSAYASPSQNKFVINFNASNSDDDFVSPIFNLNSNTETVCDGVDTHFNFNMLSGESDEYDNMHCWKLSPSGLISGATDFSDLTGHVYTVKKGANGEGADEYYILSHDVIFTFAGSTIHLGLPQTVNLKNAVEFSVDSTPSEARYKAVVEFTDADGDDVSGVEMCPVSAYRGGTTIDKLKFAYADSMQNIYLNQFVGDGEEFSVSKRFYVIKAGTIISARYKLGADVVVWISQATCKLFSASDRFTVSYQNLKGQTTSNATSFSYADDSGIWFSPISDSGIYDFKYWAINGVPQTAILIGDYSENVTVMARWAVADIYKYSVTVAGESADLVFYAKIYNYSDVKLFFNGSQTGVVGIADAALSAADGDDEICVYSFTLKGVPLIDFAKRITASLKSGAVEKDVVSRSVQDYCNKLISDTFAQASVKKIATELLAVGRSLQNYLGETENLITVPSDASTFSCDETAKGYGRSGEKNDSFYWNDPEFAADDNGFGIKITFRAPVGSLVLIKIKNGATESFLNGKADSDGKITFVIKPGFAEIDNKIEITAQSNGASVGNKLVINCGKIIKTLNADSALNILAQRVYLLGEAIREFQSGQS